MALCPGLTGVVSDGADFNPDARELAPGPILSARYARPTPDEKSALGNAEQRREATFSYGPRRGQDLVRPRGRYLEVMFDLATMGCFRTEDDGSWRRSMPRATSRGSRFIA